MGLRFGPIGSDGRAVPMIARQEPGRISLRPMVAPMTIDKAFNQGSGIARVEPPIPPPLPTFDTHPVMRQAPFVPIAPPVLSLSMPQRRTFDQAFGNSTSPPIRGTARTAPPSAPTQMAVTSTRTGMTPTAGSSTGGEVQGATGGPVQSLRDKGKDQSQAIRHETRRMIGAQSPNSNSVFR